MTSRRVAKIALDVWEGYRDGESVCLEEAIVVALQGVIGKAPMTGKRTAEVKEWIGRIPGAADMKVLDLLEDFIEARRTVDWLILDHRRSPFVDGLVEMCTSMGPDEVDGFLAAVVEQIKEAI